MSMTVRQAKAQAKWAEAEHLSTLAAAYKVAADAAREIEQNAIAEEWEKDWREIVSASVHAYAEAKSLGYFGPQKLLQLVPPAV